MEENEVLDNQVEDVNEVEPEIITSTDDSGSALALGVATGVAVIVSVIAVNRKRIAVWWDKRQEDRWHKWCDKTGRSYVTVEPIETDAEETKVKQN